MFEHIKNTWLRSFPKEYQEALHILISNNIGEIKYRKIRRCPNGSTRIMVHINGEKDLAIITIKMYRKTITFTTWPRYVILYKDNRLCFVNPNQIPTKLTHQVKNLEMHDIINDHDIVEKMIVDNEKLLKRF